MYNGPEQISNGFAHFFSSVFSQAENENLQHQPPNDYFCYTPITKKEILDALRKLKGNRAVGPNGIPGYIVKACGDLLCDPLIHIFNLSLKTSIYPKAWQISKVIPTYKSGARNDITNYRPITIVNAVSKVFEIILFQRIYEKVKGHISDYQHGFLPRKSTLTNLLTFSQYVCT